MAYAYDTAVDEVNYPQGHDQSQPQTPASDSTARAIGHIPQGGGRVRKYSLSSLDPSQLSSHLKHQETDEEYEVGVETRKRDDGLKMDPFSNGELVAMSGCSLVVLALIIVSILLTLGKMTL